jgi:hypothetical protein
LYDAEWSQRRIGQGAYADLMGQRFAQAYKRYGFIQKETLRTDLFHPPAADQRQFTLGF